MSIKLKGNGIWESSRMMLPQHKEEINRSLKKIHKKTKPELHEDEMQIIMENVGISLGNKENVTVEIFGEYSNREVKGIVTSVNQYSKKFKIEFEDGWEWVDFAEVVSVKLE